MKTYRWISVLLAPVLLGGCLLPQPDTPPVGPYSSSKRAAGPSTGTPILPQPDTPPVTPIAAGAGATEGAKGAVSNNAAGLVQQPSTPNAAADAVAQPSAASAVAAPAASSAPLASPSPSLAAGKLSGAFDGLTVITVQVTDEPGNTTFQRSPVGTDGTFSFSLAPGRYRLLVTTDKGNQLALSQVFTVTSDETRTYAITLRESPAGATVAENAPLSKPTPTPVP